MKTLHRLLLLTLVLFCSLSVVQAKAKRKTPACKQGTPYRGCPACGIGGNSKQQTLNIQKNRDAVATNPKKITVQEIRDPANNGKFNPNMQVWVTGFVASIDHGGDKERCNCGRKDLTDVHINIVADPSEAGDQSKYVVVEFTPRWEKRFGFDDSNYDAMLQAVSDKIKGKWVKFSGWMLFDYIHTNASQSTSPNNPVCTRPKQTGCNWRATPWEVHPVTAYTIVSGP